MDQLVDYARYGELEELLQHCAVLLHDNDSGSVEDALKQEWAAFSEHVKQHLIISHETSDQHSNDDDSAAVEIQHAHSTSLTTIIASLPKLSVALSTALIPLFTTPSSQILHSPLHVAAANFNNPALLAVLLSPFPAINSHFFDPLQTTIAPSHVFQVVPALCTASLMDGSTPLHYAAVNGHEEVVRCLLERGADARIKNNEERSCVFNAEQQVWNGIPKFFFNI